MSTGERAPSPVLFRPSTERQPFRALLERALFADDAPPPELDASPLPDELDPTLDELRPLDAPTLPGHPSLELLRALASSDDEERGAGPRAPDLPPRERLPVAVGTPTAHYLRGDGGALERLDLEATELLPDDDDPFASVPDAPMIGAPRLPTLKVFAEEEESLEISIEVLREARAAVPSASRWSPPALAVSRAGRERLLTPRSQLESSLGGAATTRGDGKRGRDAYRAALEALATRRRAAALVHARLAVAYDPTNESYRALVTDLEKLAEVEAGATPLPVVRGRPL